jgi:hypothetical protein
MCGIHGMVLPERPDDGKGYRYLFENLWILNTLRGTDGSGLFGMPRKGVETEFVKMPYPAHMALDHKSVKSILNRTPDFWGMVGHTRAATTGGLKVDSTHPFVVDHITLVHNGTVMGGNTLERRWTYDCDSEWVAWLLATRDRDEVLSRLCGAFTLVWHDNKRNTLNLIRNEERPLFIMKTEADNLFFASEHCMLQFVQNRFDMKLKKGNHGDGIHEVPPMSLHMILPNGKIKVKEIKKYVEPRPTWTPPERHGDNLTMGYGRVKKQRQVVLMGKAAEDRLGKVNKKVGSRVEFMGTYLELPSARSKGGALSGYTDDLDPLMCIAHNYAGKKYTTNQYMYSGAIVGASVEDGETILLLDQIKRTKKEIPEKGKYSKEPTVLVKGSNRSWPSFKDYQEWVAQLRLTKQQKREVPAVEKQIETRKPGENTHVNLGGIWLPMEVAREDVENGCHVCLRPIGMAHFDKCSWSNGALLCPDCTLVYGHKPGSVSDGAITKH